MVKSEWGQKHQCSKCGTRFYDLGRNNPVQCISCDHSWTVEPILKSKQQPTFEETTVTTDSEDSNLLEDENLLEEGEDAAPVEEEGLNADDNDLSKVVDKPRDDDES